MWPSGNKKALVHLYITNSHFYVSFHCRYDAAWLPCCHAIPSDLFSCRDFIFAQTSRWLSREDTTAVLILVDWRIHSLFEHAHVENNTFIVELDYTSVTYPVTYGIQLYSDTEFKKYFYSGGWESYVAPWNYTLALTPREWRTEFLDETAKALRWSAVYNSSFRQETHYWVNETGIYNQFYCHVNIAGLKPTWHLEPLRPDYGYGYTLSMGCNPE